MSVVEAGILVQSPRAARLSRGERPERAPALSPRRAPALDEALAEPDSGVARPRLGPLPIGALALGAIGALGALGALGSLGAVGRARHAGLRVAAPHLAALLQHGGLRTGRDWQRRGGARAAVRDLSPPMTRRRRSRA
ncbi:unnamed protein product [Arctia plantaginis]|uniref:Uncharacterized protein n=1 Tax=Arctia plantaginis TaxID=874455 RepID=A0A8S0ZQ48_ARCPL|nr:unnamed protein product [Arctia plantaginis]